MLTCFVSGFFTFRFHCLHFVLDFLCFTSVKINYIITVNNFFASFGIGGYHSTELFYFFINWLHFLTFLFCLGLFGALFNNKTFITVLLNLELMLFSIGMIYILFSVFLMEYHLQVYSIIFLVLAAAESCLGLAVAVVLLRTQGTILLEDIGSSRT